MQRRARSATIVMLSFLILLLASGTVIVSTSANAEDEATVADSPATTSEARARARLLHETIHGALQVVHRDFFQEDESLSIPSKSLEDVFSELERSHNVELRWLAVNARAMDTDHEPQNEFERVAAKALQSGKNEYESNTPDRFRFVGSIRLSARCLKCHLPLRSDNKDRAAGLVITMPLNGPPKEK